MWPLPARSTVPKLVLPEGGRRVRCHGRGAVGEGQGDEVLAAVRAGIGPGPSIDESVGCWSSPRCYPDRLIDGAHPIARSCVLGAVGVLGMAASCRRGPGARTDTTLPRAWLGAPNF